MFYSFLPYEKLVDIGQYFDENANLLYMPISHISLSHTSMTSEYAHHIYESLEYTLYLLYSDKENNKEKAEAIIAEVLRHQCLNKNSSLFGYWKMLAEEELESIKAHDINYNSKIGTALIQLLQDYTDFLSKELVDALEISCINTTFPILSIRNQLNPNTILQSVYVSVLCGEMFDRPEYVIFGEQKLQDLYNSIKYHNSLFEFNDIMHSIKNLRIISHLIQHTNNKLCIDLGKKITNEIWHVLATHFHHSTLQISGPFAITENDFVTQELYNFLYNALNHKVYFPHAKKIDEIVRCPIEYFPYFSGQKNTEFSQMLVSRGMVSPFFRFSMTASTYIRPSYTLGSFNRELFWELRRPFIGYFGDTNNLYCYKMYVLHNFQSYSSAAFHSSQYQGYLLGHVSFLTDRGDRHINFDGPNPKITAKDLRIRFSITGNIDQLEIKQAENTLTVCHDNIKLIYNISYAEVSGFDLRFSYTKDASTLYFDIVIYSGKNKVIDFAAMEKAIASFSFLITSTDKEMYTQNDCISNGMLTSTIPTSGFELMLKTPIKPGVEVVCMGHDEQYINSTRIEEYVAITNEKIKNYLNIKRTNQHQAMQIPIAVPELEKSKLMKKMDNIYLQKTEDLSKYILSILNEINESDFSIAIQKRLAVQIIVNIFECIKNNDYNLYESISHKYTDIFRKIIESDSYQDIRYHISKLCHTIYKNQDYIESQQKNITVIKDITRLIDDNLFNPNLSLNFIASTLGYSAAHLSRIFTDATNMNYVTYVQKQKVNYAMEQLSSKSMTTKEISEKLGYSNPNSFMRMFRHITGITVTQFLSNKKVRK